MSAFEITLPDRTEIIDDADGYQLEGPLTTFFRSDHGRSRLDAWAVRVASYRSSDISTIRRLGDSEPSFRVIEAPLAG